MTLVRAPLTLRLATGLFALYLLALQGYCIARTLNLAGWTLGLTYAIPLLLSMFGLLHAVATRGWRAALAMFAAACGLALFAETLGATTGFPFGSYAYTDTLGLKIFGVVPALIPLAWMMIAYPAWEAVRLVLPVAPPVTRIVLAALAVTAYDLSLDPRMVADGHWVWPGGGSYFGIPLSNFAGWVLTAAIIFATWHMLERRWANSGPAPHNTLAAWAFVVLWIGEALAQALFWNGPLIGAIVFVAMGALGAPTLARLRGR